MLPRSETLLDRSSFGRLKTRDQQKILTFTQSQASRKHGRSYSMVGSMDSAVVLDRRSRMDKAALYQVAWSAMTFLVQPLGAICWKAKKD
jgi:hypothetical protein